MNNYERIKLMTFEEMHRFVFLRTHCLDCPMNYSKKCLKDINKCHENIKLWLLEETTMEPPQPAFTEFISVMVILFFTALGLWDFVEKIITTFGN